MVQVERQKYGDFCPDVAGRSIPLPNVRQVGDSRERSRVLVDGSMDVIWFDDSSAPELDSARDASVRQGFGTSVGPIRKTTATRFSLACAQPLLTIRECRYER